MVKNYISEFDDDTQIYIFKGVNHKINAKPYVLYIKGGEFIVDRVPILKKGTLYDEYDDAYEIIYNENDICEGQLVDSKTTYVKTSMKELKDNLTQIKRVRDHFK